MYIVFHVWYIAGFDEGYISVVALFNGTENNDTISQSSSLG